MSTHEDTNAVSIRLTVPIVEHLMKLDPTLEPKLQNAVIENLGKRLTGGMKGDIYDKAKQAAVNMIKAEIESEVGRAVVSGKSGSAKWQWAPSDKFRAAVEQHYDELVTAEKTEVYKTINEKVRQISADLEARLDHMTKKLADDIVSDQFECRVNDEVRRRLQVAADAAS